MLFSKFMLCAQYTIGLTKTSISLTTRRGKDELPWKKLGHFNNR